MLSVIKNFFEYDFILYYNQLFSIPLDFKSIFPLLGLGGVEISKKGSSSDDERSPENKWKPKNNTIKRFFFLKYDLITPDIDIVQIFKTILIKIIS